MAGRDVEQMVASQARHCMSAASPAPPTPPPRSVAHALLEGGGRVEEGARLGQGVTHAVCPPEAALAWLGMGEAGDGGGGGR